MGGIGPAGHDDPQPLQQRRVQGMRVQPVRQQHPFFHDPDRVCHLQPVVQPVVHRQNADAPLPVELAQLGGDVPGGLVVDVGKGLIQ